MALQIFGTPRCQDTKKAQRFFKERGIAFQLIDLSDKGISQGELRSVAAALGIEALPDRTGKRWKDRGLDHMEIDLEETLLADPLLLRTPIVRDGKKAAVGFDLDAWKGFAAL
ncbi:MAG TPA: arsenate reductase family protein [Rectinemataceae bacterium]|nr:arsenate reductase family protein [Rectinemataceae bacterium]